MFPYVEQPSFTWGPFTIDAFRVLVLCAVVTGFEVCVRRAPRFGLDKDLASSLTAWMIAWGFVGSHVFDVVAYYPERIREDPLELFKIWGSMSSFGGIFGGVIAALVMMHRKGMSISDRVAYIDCVGFAFPFAWLFGRAGCAVAHDHMGVASTSWLAVQFPGGPRLDLGLLEFLYTIVIALLFVALDRRPRPVGFFVALFFTVYGPVRFALDMFRTEDARYLSWTPGQFLALGSTALGTWLLVWIHRRARAAATR